MTAPDVLRRFADDELVRAPLLADQLVEETMRALQLECDRAAGRAAQGLIDLMHALHERRSAFTRAFVRTLDAQVRREFDPTPAEARPDIAPGIDPARAARALGGLALVDDSQVEIDVEISRTIETIGSSAEHELRELASFAAALVGDNEVTRDHNPLRPEAIARALWDATPSLCAQARMRLAFMRHAADPLAQLMRKTYTGACARIEAMGIEPATHRTVIIAGECEPRRPAPLQAGAKAARARDPASASSAHLGAAVASGQTSVTKPTTKASTRRPHTTDSSPPGSAAGCVNTATFDPVEALLHHLTAEVGPRASGTSDRGAPACSFEDTRSASGRQRVELVGRLFEELRADRRLDEDLKALLARLQAPAQRLAFNHPELLQTHAHPLWLLLDRIALQGELHPPPGDPARLQMLHDLHALVDALRRGQAFDRDACERAHQGLLAYERSRFERRRCAAEAERMSLQALEDQTAAGGPLSTHPAALDVGQLDTVPAKLLGRLERVHSDEDGPADRVCWLSDLREADWVRLFMQGRWAHAQLLWQGRHREYWLLADGTSDRTWAVRRGALERMREARLLSRVEPHSLVREAARRTLRRLDKQDAG